jgi:hypothetical protein
VLMTASGDSSCDGGDTGEWLQSQFMITAVMCDCKQAK